LTHQHESKLLSLQVGQTTLDELHADTSKPWL
jgi:hypothetical protein